MADSLLREQLNTVDEEKINMVEMDPCAVQEWYGTEVRQTSLSFLLTPHCYQYLPKIWDESRITAGLKMEPEGGPHPLFVEDATVKPFFSDPSRRAALWRF